MPRDERPGTEFTMYHSEDPPTSLIVGFAEFGLAGLTAVDYLTQELDLVETGHLEASSLPTITPFAAGRPRHHTRLYSDGEQLAVLVGELAVPRGASGPLSEELMTWADGQGVEEITILSGVPFPHGPDQHEPFYVATEDYAATRLDGVDIEPMGNGFLDGVNASLMQRGIDSDLRVGLVTTPVHEPAPDAEAAIRLLGAFGEVHDREVDVGPLEAFAAEIRQHYAELAARLEQIRDDDRPDDRMFM